MHVDFKEQVVGNYGNKLRLTEQVRQYWLNVKGDLAFPPEEKINFLELEDNWQSCFLVKYEFEQFSYIYLGDELVNAYGDSFLHKENCEKIIFPSTEPLLARFKQVVQTKNLLEYEDDFINSNGLKVRYRAIILPLGKNNEADKIGFLFGGMRWKAYL